MTALVLATAVLLQASVPQATGSVMETGSIGPVTAAARADAGVATRMQDQVGTVVPRVAVPRIGEDKVQHFLMSYAIASFTYGAARAAGIEQRASLHGAMAGTLAVGAAKELVDRRTGGDPSFADFFADILGAAAAYVILRQVH